jgi:glycosidase
MQWDDSAHGRFSKATPWMKANPSYTYINASSQVWDLNSVYTFWQMMLRFRKTYKKVAVYGKFKMIDYENPDILSYSKRHGKELIVVVMNFRKESAKYNVKNYLEGNERLKFILSSVDEHTEGILKPFEAVIYTLDN